MANEINNGGPAFPGQPAFSAADDLATSENIGAPGMSLRDWFAGQALAGEMAGDDLGDGPIALRSNENAKLMAERAYHMADAMLSARNIGEQS